MPDPDGDLDYLRAGLQNLEAYLLSGELYWRIGAPAKPGEPPFPSLTLSGLLLARSRLSAYPLSLDMQFERERIYAELDRIQTRWRLAWENKAAREFHARLNLWQSYMEDYRDDPGNHADRYPYEVSRRVMLELLMPVVEHRVGVETAMLTGLDEILKSVFVPGEFIWDKALSPVFPMQPFWYLYGKPR